MTRRDMIIIAILVNAGLLAVLFMMAINSDTDKISDPIVVQQPIAEVPISISSTTVSEPTYTIPTPADEGDNALTEFNTAPAPLPIIGEEVTIVEADASKGDASTPAPAEGASPEIKSTPVPPAKEVKDSKDAEGKVIEVTVKRGDSLDKIARANNSTIKAIKSANGLKNSKLDIGQVLKIPVGEKKKAAAKSTTTAKAKKSESKADKADKEKADSKVASADGEFYTIKAGDNPWKIARQFHIKVDDLLKLNNLNEDKARNLKAGDKIRVK